MQKTGNEGDAEWRGRLTWPRRYSRLIHFPYKSEMAGELLRPRAAE